MPRRVGVARKTKYEQVPVNRTNMRFHAKLMTNGKRRLAQRIGHGFGQYHRGHVA